MSGRRQKAVIASITEVGAIIKKLEQALQRLERRVAALEAEKPR